MNIYESPHYKKLLIAPAILLVVALLAISTMGLRRGIDLQGGVAVTAPVSAAVDTEALAKEIQAGFAVEDLSVKKTASPTGAGVLIEFSGNRELLNAERALQAKNYDEVVRISGTFTGELNVTGEPADRAAVYYSKAREKFKNGLVSFLSSKLGTAQDQFSIRDIGSVLGTMFWSNAVNAMIIAFVLVSILIFFFFRTVVPSVAVIQAMFFDVLVAVGAMAALGIPITMPTIAALLMLIGYSVDTDILLTTRALHRKEGTVQVRMWESLKTGLTMTFAAIASVLSIYFISAAVGMDVLHQISTILFFGLFADIFATWCNNAVIVQWYALRKGKK